MAHILQPSLKRHCCELTLFREAGTSCRRPTLSSSHLLRRRPRTEISRAFAAPRCAPSRLAPPLGLRRSSRRPGGCSRLAATQPASGDQQQTDSAAKPSEAAQNRGPRTEFPPFSTIQKGDVYDLRLYEVHSFMSKGDAPCMPYAIPLVFMIQTKICRTIGLRGL